MNQAIPLLKTPEKNTYRILSFKRPGRLYIFFDFGVGVYWRGALNREGRLFKKLDFLSNSLSLGAIQ